MHLQGVRPGLKLPPLPGLEASQDAMQGAVLPSLRATLNWLRRCSQEGPKAPLQVHPYLPNPGFAFLPPLVVFFPLSSLCPSLLSCLVTLILVCLARFPMPCMLCLFCGLASNWLLCCSWLGRLNMLRLHIRRQILEAEYSCCIGCARCIGTLSP